MDSTVWDHYGSQPTLAMLNSDALPLRCPSGKPVLSRHVHQTEVIPNTVYETDRVCGGQGLQS